MMADRRFYELQNSRHSNPRAGFRNSLHAPSTRGGTARSPTGYRSRPHSMSSTVRNHPPSNLSTVFYPGENDLSNTTDQAMDMDGMDIDSTADMLNLPTESAAAAAAAAATETTWPTRTAEGIFRHIFLVDITDLYNWNPSELNILEAVHLHLDTRLRLGDLSDPILPNPHQHWRLRIAIDTRSEDRGGALADIVFRLSAMQDMIRDGLGWFTGLPWEHKHFEVVVLPPR